MTHISRRKLPSKVLKQILGSLVFVLSNTKDKESMAQFLDAFLSDTEKVMLAKRLAIVYLLSEKIGETDVASTLNVTQATVSRIKLWYETKGGGYQIAIKKLKTQKLLNGLKFLTLKGIDKVIRAAAGHT